MFKKFIIILSVVLMSVIMVACQETLEPVNYDSIFEEIFEEIQLPTETSQNIDLKYESLLYPEAKISWRSNTASIITNQGEVRRPDVETEVDMVAAITYQGIVKTNRFKVNVLPVETRVFDLNAYRSDYGFASLVITNRMNQKDSVVEVATPVEFLDALKNKNNKIIKITADLNMGFYHVERELKALGKTDEEINAYTDGSFYRMNANVPVLHPTLLEEGVGQMIIQDRNEGLMIYSEYGAKISHLTTIIKTSKDIVIRNLHLTGIWEWDDDLAANYDELDWDYFTIETTQGVWLDHLKFDQSYDGLVDVKGGTSNMTFSYLDLNFQANDFIIDQINHLEATLMTDPTKNPANSRYVRIREFLSVEQIIEYTSMQKKGFNLGNTTMGLGFDTITVTIHHSRFINLADRLPRLRQGDAHVYNVLLDNTGLQRVRDMIGGTGQSLPSQAMVPTEEGAVLFENSKVVNTAEPIKTHQDSILDPEYTGRYQVLNSILVTGVDFYYGSSYEGQEGGDFFTKWKQANTNVGRLPFFMRNYQEIPYQYKTNPDLNYLVDAQSIGRVLEDNYVGPGIIPDFDWLEIRRVLSNPISPTAVRGHMIDPDSIQIEDDLVELNATFEPANPSVRNFYLGGPSYRRDVDYRLDVDTSNLNTASVGTYEVYYTFTNLNNDWDTYTYTQNVLVYNPNLANEIYRYSATGEFNGTISVDYNVYRNSGTLYYLLSDQDDLTLEDIKNSNDLLSIEISRVNGRILDIETNRLPYLYMYTLREALYSEVVRLDILQEQIVEIRTIQDLNSMITSFSSTGKYYVLMNDIDMSTGRIDQLSTSNVFRGVFDGNGYTLRNYGANMLRGGLFMTINGGMIKNLTLDNFNFNVDSIFAPSSDDPNVLVETRPSDDAGILATYVYGSAVFTNITIQNSSLKTVRNYGAALIGRLRTGEATFNQIRIINVKVDAMVTAAKYTGGLIGGIETNTKLYMNDIFVDGLTITHQQSDMIGAVIGRVRSYAELNRIVLLNVKINGRHNLGILAGKEDNTTTFVSASHVFADVDFTFQPDVSGVYSEYHGYVVGNPDAGKITVENYYVVSDPDFMSNSKGQNTQTGFIDLESVDEAWWQTNLNVFTQSELWEYDASGVMKLKD